MSISNPSPKRISSNEFTSIIPKEKLDQIYAKSETSRTSFSENLILSELITENKILDIYSKGLGIPLVDLRNKQIGKVVLDKVPVKFAWYYKFFPLTLDQRKLTIAVPRMMDVNSLDEIRLGLGLDIDIVLAPSTQIEEMLKRHYGLGAETVDKIISQQSSQTTSAMVLPGAAQDEEDIEKLTDSASVVQLVNQIILDAYRKRASDIHIEPSRGKIRLRYRIDGVLHEAKVPPDLKRFYMSILSRIKFSSSRR